MIIVTDGEIIVTDGEIYIEQVIIVTDGITIMTCILNYMQVIMVMLENCKNLFKVPKHYEIQSDDYLKSRYKIFRKMFSS